MDKDVTDKSARELFGDGETAANTREKLLDRATDLFYTHGIHAVGLDRIFKEVGVTKTTFYNHFESKDDLTCEVLRRRHVWETEKFMQAVAEVSAGDPRLRLLAMFDVLHNWFTAPQFRGCQFINAAAEFPTRNDPVHQEAARHKLATKQIFRDAAEAAGASSPDDLSNKIMVLFEGAITLRQVTGDDQAAATARQVAEMLVNESIGE
ncbi:MAG: TetR/AcrR family transcriptional regulator [bacterium]|nr:TetR/AcrR family transcriptional regulator [bacterium]